MGCLNYIKIWHDNTGKGDKASWFLNYIIVHDLQTKQKYYFLCNDWLAVEHSDGKIERGLFVAYDKQKTELKYLINKQAKTYVNDNHLWMSVFNKPIQSYFTRFERVTCCFVFHYITMALNILYYQAPLRFFDNTIQINLSFVTFSIEQVKHDKLIEQI